MRLGALCGVLLLGLVGCKPSPAGEPVAAGKKRLEVSEAQARAWGLPPVAFAF